MTWSKLTLRWSNSVFSLPFLLSNGTISLRMEKSPVSFRYATVPKMSHIGSSLKPPPMSLLPRFVSGWYWW